MNSTPGEQIFGRIYTITSSETDVVYIGSTITTLSRRLEKHRSDYRRYLNNKGNYITSFELVKYADATIELVEERLFADMSEMHRLEGEHIGNADNCVNKMICGRDMKAYKHTHYVDQIDKYKERAKMWHERNRNKVYERRSQVIECPVCSNSYTYGNRSRHVKSNAHIGALSRQSQ